MYIKSHLLPLIKIYVHAIQYLKKIEMMYVVNQGRSNHLWEGSTLSNSTVGFTMLFQRNMCKYL